MLTKLYMYFAVLSCAVWHRVCAKPWLASLAHAAGNRFYMCVSPSEMPLLVMILITESLLDLPAGQAQLQLLPW